MNFICPILLVLPFLKVVPCGTTQSYFHPIIYSYINIHVNILKVKSRSHVHFNYKLTAFSCEYESSKND
jgi:hypothetical protein